MTRRHSLALAILLVHMLALGGCKKDDEGPCTLGDPEACGGGQVCEAVEGGEPACFEPLILRGDVFDAATTLGIGNATVVALDANGQTASDAVMTAADGTYSLTVPATRDVDGNVLSVFVTLRVDASGYVAFPTPPRFALPIDLATAVSMDDEWTVQNSTTSVALFGLVETVPATLYGTITGTVTGTAAPGALVVAEQGDPANAVSTAIVGSDGTFVLYNVPIGIETTVAAYAAGVHVTPVTTQVPNPDESVVVALIGDTNGLATVTGSIMTRNAPNFPATGTSIILMLESTFLETVGRGLSPAGLRVGGVSGDFSIPNVPPGRYVVLAAFENDGEVRDPDLSLGGNEIPVIVVPLEGGVIDAGAFSVTDALPIVSPGASGLEVVTTVGAFSWGDDSGEDGFEFRLFDTYGEIVFTDVDVPKHTGGPTVTYTPTLPALVPGMIYQFRVKSWKSDAMAPGGRTYLSQSEDLLGVFEYAP
jgi:hypothetical protein